RCPRGRRRRSRWVSRGCGVSQPSDSTRFGWKAEKLVFPRCSGNLVARQRLVGYGAHRDANEIGIVPSTEERRRNGTHQRAHSEGRCDVAARTMRTRTSVDRGRGYGCDSRVVEERILSDESRGRSFPREPSREAEG